MGKDRTLSRSLRPIKVSLPRQAQPTELAVPRQERRMPRGAEEKVEFLIEDAISEWERGAYFEAEQYFRQAMSEVRSQKLPVAWHVLATALLGEMCDEQYRSSEAMQLYRSAVEFAESKECEQHLELRYKCSNNLAFLLRAADRYADGEEFYLRALKLVEAAPERNWEHHSVVLNNLGALYHLCGYYNEALEMHHEALRSCLKQTNIDSRWIAKIHRGVALAAIFSDKPKLALEHLREARERARMVPDFPEDAYIELWVTESAVQYLQNDLFAAEELCIKAVALAQKGERRPGGILPIMYNNLGCIYAKAGLFEQAHEMFADAHLLRLSDLGSHDENLRDTHYNLMLVCARLEDHEGASRHLTRFEKLGGDSTKKLRADLSVAEFAEQLIFYVPTPFAPPVRKPLGASPKGLDLKGS